MTTTDKLAAALRRVMNESGDVPAGLDANGANWWNEAHRALAEYDAERDNDAGREGSVALVHAYAHGAANGGSIDWANLNQAHELACVDLGPERVAAIAAQYHDDDAEGDGDED